MRKGPSLARHQRWEPLLNRAQDEPRGPACNSTNVGRPRLSSGRLIGAACCLISLVVLAAVVSSASSAADRRGETRLTIDAWPGGLFGYVKASSARCGEGREVTVFKQRGPERSRRRDVRVGKVEAKRSSDFIRWSLRTHKSGRFYARVGKRAGCEKALSRTIRTRPEAGGGTGGGDDDKYPVCSPFVSEGPTTICKIPMLRFGIFTGRGCGGFGETQGTCSGKADEGPYPWGLTPAGFAPDVGFDWNQNDRGVLFVAYKPGQREGNAFLSGTSPAPNSARFTINDGYAQGDAGYGSGDHFYTPDLPGQDAGEVGGPLYLDFNYSSGGSTVKIHGYLYLKQS